MAKKVDITEKLSFDGNPVLVVKGHDLEVNADAATVLKVMGVLGEESTPKQVLDMYNLIFPDKTRKEIENLKLSFNDLQILVSSALNLITGEADDAVETQIPATT